MFRVFLLSYEAVYILNCSIHERNIQNGNYFKGKKNLELEKLLFLFFNPCIVLFITTSETAKLKVIHHWVQWASEDRFPLWRVCLHRLLLSCIFWQEADYPWKWLELECEMLSVFLLAAENWHWQRDFIQWFLPHWHESITDKCHIYFFWLWSCVSMCFWIKAHK